MIVSYSGCLPDQIANQFNMLPPPPPGLEDALAIQMPECGCGGCNRGLGLFDTPFDLSTWGFGEWAIAIVAGYTIISFISDAMTVKRKISASSRRASSTRKRKADVALKRARLEREESLI
jgi:hypothetical protein